MSTGKREALIELKIFRICQEAESDRLKVNALLKNLSAERENIDIKKALRDLEATTADLRSRLDGSERRTGKESISDRDMRLGWRNVIDSWALSLQADVKLKAAEQQTATTHRKSDWAQADYNKLISARRANVVSLFATANQALQAHIKQIPGAERDLRDAVYKLTVEYEKLRLIYLKELKNKKLSPQTNMEMMALIQAMNAFKPALAVLAPNVYQKSYGQEKQSTERQEPLRIGVHNKQ